MEKAQFVKHFNSHTFTTLSKSQFSLKSQRSMSNSQFTIHKRLFKWQGVKIQRPLFLSNLNSSTFTVTKKYEKTFPNLFSRKFEIQGRVICWWLSSSEELLALFWRTNAKIMDLSAFGSHTVVCFHKTTHTFPQSKNTTQNQNFNNQDCTIEYKIVCCYQSLSQSLCDHDMDNDIVWIYALYFHESFFFCIIGWWWRWV